LHSQPATGILVSVVTEGVQVNADEQYAEAERIALRMGFHRAFVQVAAAQGEAAELARARVGAAARRGRFRSRSHR